MHTGLGELQQVVGGSGLLTVLGQPRDGESDGEPGVGGRCGGPLVEQFGHMLLGGDLHVDAVAVRALLDHVGAVGAVGEVHRLAQDFQALDLHGRARPVLDRPVGERADGFQHHQVLVPQEVGELPPRALVRVPRFGEGRAVGGEAQVRDVRRGGQLIVPAGDRAVGPARRFAEVRLGADPIGVARPVGGGVPAGAIGGDIADNALVAPFERGDARRGEVLSRSIGDVVGEGRCGQRRKRSGERQRAHGRDRASCRDQPTVRCGGTRSHDRP
ncbi:hypothetical protein NORO109296_14225 [Nocardiopsis rhodophaea]